MLSARLFIFSSLAIFACGASQYQDLSTEGVSQQGSSWLQVHNKTGYTAPKVNPCGAIECPPKPSDPKTPPKPIITPVAPSQPGCSGPECQGKTDYTAPKVNPCGAIECPPRPSDPKNPPKPIITPVAPSQPDNSRPEY